MALPSWINPRNWFRRDITAEQLAALGLYTPPAAGVQLTHQVAAGVSAVYCADRVISEDLATLPMMVYDGDPLDDGAVPLPRHPVSKLLRNPNPEQTGPVFWSAFQHFANVWGFGLAEIAWNGGGQAAQLWLIHPGTARLEREAGRLVYYAPGPGGGMVRLNPEDVLFLPGFSPDGSVGYQLLQVARTTLSTAAAIQQFAASRFANGFRPGGAIKVAGTLSETARENMRASWRALYGAGPHQAGVPMLLEEGTGWEKFDLAHNDQLQLAELSENQVGEVARFFNVSPVKLHQLGRATWGNLETLNREHVTSCLGPWIAKRNAEIDLKLVRAGCHTRHVVDRLLSADTQTRFAAWSSALSAGWMTVNEVRQREDLPPLDGGDVLRVPLNHGPAAGPTPADPPPADPEPTDPAPQEPPADGPAATDPPQPAE